MTEDDELIYKKPKKTIHYGSLEKTMAMQQKLDEIQSDEDEYEPESKKPSISRTQETTHGNVNVSNEYYELEQDM